MSKLKEMRRLRKMRLRDVAEKLKKTPQCVQKQERYGVKTFRLAHSYASVYECDWKELLD